MPARTMLLSLSASDPNSNKSQLRKSLDAEFVQIGVPALFSLAAEPVAAIADAIFVAKLGTTAQAALGIALSSQMAVSKLYNDPLLKTSTSIVAGKEGVDLEESVASALTTAIAIGLIQTLIFYTLAPRILNLMGVSFTSEMMKPAVSYLKWKSLGVPAATLILVSNGIFRGRGDTRTPLYCTVISTILKVFLDPLLIFGLEMGCAGAGVASAAAQWCVLIPLLIRLNSRVRIRIFGRTHKFYAAAVTSYLHAGTLLLLSTVSKIWVYSFTSAMAAKMGTVEMAAYSVTYSIAFAGSQLCEAISIASQVLLARNFPFNTPARVNAARRVILRSISIGVVISAVLGTVTTLLQAQILNTLTRSTEVYAAAAVVMPAVIATQVFKGLGYSMVGIILGGSDWLWSSLGSQLSAALCVGIVAALPPSLWNIWLGLTVLMATQVTIVNNINKFLTFCLKL